MCTLYRVSLATCAGDIGLFAVDATQLASCIASKYGPGKEIPYRDVMFVIRVGKNAGTILFKGFHRSLPGFVDGIVFARDATHVWVEDPADLPRKGTTVSMAVGSLLPLTPCAFDHLTLLCPKDMEAYLHGWYGQDLGVPAAQRQAWNAHMATLPARLALGKKARVERQQTATEMAADGGGGGSSSAATSNKLGAPTDAVGVEQVMATGHHRVPSCRLPSAADKMWPVTSDSRLNLDHAPYFRQPRRLFGHTILGFHQRFFGTQLFLFLF